MLIRGYVPRDLEEVIRVYQDATEMEEEADHEPYAPEDEDEEDDDYEPDASHHALDAAEWDASLRGNFAVVAVVNGMIVAFGDIDRSGRLNRVYVMAEYQNRTIGTQLVEILMSFFPSLVVMVESPESARDFFEKLGFVAIKKLKSVEKGKEVTTFLMSSPILDSAKQQSIAGRNYWIRADV